jgi:hypothetical protein
LERNLLRHPAVVALGVDLARFDALTVASLGDSGIGVNPDHRVNPLGQ